MTPPGTVQQVLIRKGIEHKGTATMATLQQITEGMGEAWGGLMDGWRRLYRRAAGAITRFRPVGRDTETRQGRDIELRSTGWGVLACEVFDDDDRVVVRLEAPGMEKEDFDLQVLDEHLVVRGKKQMARERTEGGYHISECAYGSFERAIPLPAEVEADKASASYRRGVLRVDLPKSAQHRRRSITVNVD
jgi:HSP20 family protein